MISAILLAGGKGVRMGGSLPKQFLLLNGLPIALHSLQVFFASRRITEVIVVCAEEHRHHFAGFPVVFAEPGERRQDSLFNGLKKAKAPWICVHDAARPLIDDGLLERLFIAGMEVGAATVGMPVKATIKEANAEGIVARTLERSAIWEIQTPQLISRKILEEGFTLAQAQALTVTDDVSLAELAGYPVKLVEGSYANIKVTTPEDLAIVEALL